MKRLKKTRGSLGIYLISQNVEGLRGVYLTRAMVVAQTPDKAVTALRRHFEDIESNQNEIISLGGDADPYEVPTIDNERLVVEHIGNGAHHRVVVAETATDY